MKLQLSIEVEFNTEARWEDSNELVYPTNKALEREVHLLRKQLNSTLDGFVYLRYPTSGFKVVEIKEVK